MKEQNKVRRVYTRKKEGCDVEAQNLLRDLKGYLGIQNVQAARIYQRYDVSGLTDQQYLQARTVVFAEPPVDDIYDEICDFENPDYLLPVEPMPGQYDQRADSAAQCLQVLTCGERPLCRTAKIFAFDGSFSLEEKEKIKKWLINPLESRLAALEKPASLIEEPEQPADIQKADGFCRFTDLEIEQFLTDGNFVMTKDDLLFVQDYFKKEGRDPTWTELKVLDTYWSDHCRHTTFLTHIREVTFPEAEPLGRILKQDWQDYLLWREKVHGDQLPEKPPCLMDLATLAMKALRQSGDLDDLDDSPETNASGIRVTIPVDGEPTEYLILFKNETHNHPTEMEPFGGASTCIGGAIRDPLSGRAYVYQAMRITGSGDPTRPIEETLPGKLPQRKITTTAAAGYSSYGNQIGVPAGHVAELYHPGYIAKRMELGAVIGAVPAAWVRRETPAPGDRVILLGGRTGRDGCGGATGSSKAHDERSLVRSEAEVQKGDPTTERKIVRLFRDPSVLKMIKRCNDFGAGGVSVAIGELADGLRIDLDLVPVKYEGLDGTELAISESQERMAVVVDASDVARFIEAADKENLEAVAVAEVTDTGRVIMLWRKKVIVDLERWFLNSNGVPQQTQIEVTVPSSKTNWFDQKTVEQAGPDFTTALKKGLSSLSACSQRGLVEQFDSTAGAGTLLMPLGGRFQLTPEEGMAALIPLDGSKQTNACSLMSFGFDPDLSSFSPYHGATYAVIESLARIAALGGDASRARLSFQEYFRHLATPEDWGQPLSALLGALHTQMACRVPSIGGKDSMSGTFQNLHVPPTLVSFAVQISRAEQVLSATLDLPDRPVWLLPVPHDPMRPGLNLPDCRAFMDHLAVVHELSRQGKLVAAATVRQNGAAVACARMCFGNKLGFSFEDLSLETLFCPQPGALLLVPVDDEAAARLQSTGAYLIGRTIKEQHFILGTERLSLDDALFAFESTLEPVFPTRTDSDYEPELDFIAMPENDQAVQRQAAKIWRKPKPCVFIPVFPGTNCEYDSIRAFSLAGAKTDLLVVRNNTPSAIQETIEAMARKIKEAQILMLPGGFSAGGEPDGGGKMIAAFFRHPQLTEAVYALLQKDGLILGICDGFQALIKLGLLPFGQICERTSQSPALTLNRIGRHLSRTVTTRVVTNRSPWLQFCQPGDLHQIAVSHTEGRFIASSDDISQLARKGQIATQYVGMDGCPSLLTDDNPNGSMAAIEGITSEDGRIFGKIGHSERFGPYLMRNRPGVKDQHIFEAGVAWFA